MEGSSSRPVTSPSARVSKSCRPLSEAARWVVAEWLLAQQDTAGKSTTGLKYGAFADVARVTGHKKHTVSGIWRAYQQGKLKNGGVASLAANLKGVVGRKPLYTNDQLREKLLVIPIGRRTSFRVIATQAKLSIKLVRRAIAQDILRPHKVWLKHVLRPHHLQGGLHFVTNKVVFIEASKFQVMGSLNGGEASRPRVVHYEAWRTAIQDGTDLLDTEEDGEDGEEAAEGAPGADPAAAVGDFADGEFARGFGFRAPVGMEAAPSTDSGFPSLDPYHVDVEQLPPPLPTASEEEQEAYFREHLRGASASLDGVSSNSLGFVSPPSKGGRMTSHLLVQSVPVVEESSGVGLGPTRDRVDEPARFWQTPWAFVGLPGEAGASISPRGEGAGPH